MSVPKTVELNITTSPFVSTAEACAILQCSPSQLMRYYRGWHRPTSILVDGVSYSFEACKKEFKTTSVKELREKHTAEITTVFVRPVLSFIRRSRGGHILIPRIELEKYLTARLVAA